MTDLVLDDYLKNEEEEAKLQNLPDDERQIHEEWRKFTGFVSQYQRDPEISESFMKMGEEMIAEKINEIFRDAPRERKLDQSIKQSIRDSMMKNTEKNLSDAFGKSMQSKF